MPEDPKEKEFNIVQAKQLQNGEYWVDDGDDELQQDKVLKMQQAA